MKPGIQSTKKGIRFAVHSNANRVDLLLFNEPDASVPARIIKMKKWQKQIWHTTVPDAKPGQFYLYRTDAVPEQWLIDPYARAVHTPYNWGDPSGLQPGKHHRTGKMFPKGVIVDETFNWGQVKRPGKPLKDSIIYEAHLRGFTRSKGGGSYLDFIQEIPYLKELGITAVEFLPLFEFDELEYFVEGNRRKNLLNFWGYSTRSFFAPMSRFAASTEPGASVHEFKTMVKALHNAGIEVILDVVFNHTVEGSFNGPTYNFRGLDEATYYLLTRKGDYYNWSGCGNSVNANHPLVTDFIVDCLKYWAEDMHVDGFRFDLATALCRGATGELLENPPIIRAIEAEPALKHVKLFAEAWDAGGGYQVGSFPGKRFADWNGKYRDEVRSFWNEGYGIGVLATRIAGSSDLYKNDGGSPLKSLNFITAHDGYTLADVVAYERKSNEANGENNRDGENHNHSQNFGHEGPTDDPAICERRLKQQKNLIATLLLSQGVPMMTAGDEFGRTQKGNNNAYCQDNEISWVDWSLLKKNRDLFEFTKALIAIRKNYPVLRRDKFFTGNGDIEWLCPENQAFDWDYGRSLGLYLPGRNKLLTLINNADHSVAFVLPAGRWSLRLCTDPSCKKAVRTKAFTVPANSIAILS